MKNLLEKIKGFFIAVAVVTVRYAKNIAHFFVRLGKGIVAFVLGIGPFCVKVVKGFVPFCKAVIHGFVPFWKNAYHKVTHMTKKDWQIFWDGCTTGLLILLFCSPVAILLYILIWFLNK